MHDSRGAPLKVGDRVLIEAEITSVQDSDNGYCNVTVQTKTPAQKDPPPMAGSCLTLNTRMLSKVGLVLLLLAALAGPSLAQMSAEPQVQVDEVLRRGNMVSSCGEGPRSGPDESFKAAMAPPLDDSGLWHVTVWSIPGCQACEHLKSDFRKAPELLAFVATPDKSLPWAFYHEYNGADETQKDRREKYKVTRYPTVVIQPPRALAADGDGIWGDPGTVVFYDNGGYSDPKVLAGKIRKAVYQFAEVQGKRGYPKAKAVAPKQSGPPERVEPMGNEGASLPTDRSFYAGGAGQAPEQFQEAGTAPPVATPPKVDPFNPVVPTQPQGPPVTYPPENPQPNQTPAQPAQPGAGAVFLQLLNLVGMLLGGLAPGNTTTALGVIILVGLKLFELKSGKKPPAWLTTIATTLEGPSAPGPGPGPNQQPPAAQ